MSEEKKPLSIRDEIATDEGIKKDGVVYKPQVEAPAVMPNWMKALTSDSPDKEISAYQSHPLNYDGDNSTGRIIRGAEGIIGNLNKSAIDIVVGLMQKVAKLFEKKSAEQE